MNRTRFTTVSGLSCLAAIALCCLSVQAQSGRRQTRPAPVAPVPTPTPEPTPKPKPKEKQSELRFLVGVDRTAYATYPLYYYDAVLHGCADKLRSGSSALVDVAERDLTRGEAIKKAKAEKTTYVVLLRLTPDGMGSSANSGYDDLVLEYVVFAPLSAKVATNGRSYQNANRKGPLIVGPSSRGPSSAIYREQLLKYAGEDAGTRILKALHLSEPVLRLRNDEIAQLRNFILVRFNTQDSELPQFRIPAIPQFPNSFTLHKAAQSHSGIFRRSLYA